MHRKKMSGSGSPNNSSNRNGYSFPDFSLRRLLLQTRAARNTYGGRMCDVERGGSNSGKNEKGGCSSNSMNSNKVSDCSFVRSFMPDMWYNIVYNICHQ